MKFAIISRNNIQTILQVLNMFGIDIDKNKPDFVITYGGDGSILYAERKYPGVPKITLRKSDAGSKCMYSEFELEDVIIKIEKGEYKIKEELKLETLFQGRYYLSLNEVQLHNTFPTRAVRFSVFIDNLILYDHIIGDGVIIATPFGSTAYYRSVGGEPFIKGIGIALNNPSNIRYRPTIVDENSDINIKIDRDDGLLLFDNDDNILKVMEKEDIIIKASKESAKFVVIAK